MTGTIHRSITRSENPGTKGYTSHNPLPTRGTPEETKLREPKSHPASILQPEWRVEEGTGVGRRPRRLLQIKLVMHHDWMMVAPLDTFVKTQQTAHLKIFTSGNYS